SNMFKDPHPIEDFFGLKPELKERPKQTSLAERMSGFGSSLRLLPRVLSVRERYLILGFSLIIIISIVTIPFSALNHFTKAAPAYGGRLIEGIVGQPRHINPLLDQTNDADRDLTSLIYSGLLKYNEEGKLVPDLAKSYEISSDGLNYTVYLKDDSIWHDEKPVTADDIVFTITAAQNPDYGSQQRFNWQGVTIEKVNDTTVIFKLKNKYAQFLNNMTIGILPKHIWQDVQPINFSLSDYNLKPIGSGPYIFDKFEKDELGKVQSYELSANKDYYDGRPYINTVEIQFYDSEDEMISAYNRNQISDIAFVSAENLKKLKFKQRLNIQELKLPRYFGIFFNQSQNQILANKNVRLALNHATDKQAIIHDVLADKGTAVYSPLIENVLDVEKDVKKYEFDLDNANKILTADGWGSPDEKGVLKKKNTRLSVRITTSTWPELVNVANMIKAQWAKAGVDVTIEALPASQLQQVIKERGYEALLFGEILNLDPDPIALWHSSQKRDPGLNLALYDNKTADGLLEEARQTLNPLERTKKYDDFQKIVIEDAPGVFIYNPLYLYPISKDIKGFSTKIISMPSDRFSNIEKWYIDTKRVWGD
ncbi:hypothetical protein KW791_02255, partial [Candidatus Parcubacteria bacterium]|nr:hypothetical protein [Candidatus Parcubacteria bacterium]